MHEDAIGLADETMVADDAPTDALVETVAADPSTGARAPGEPGGLAIGAVVGRHVVVGTLGAGGMGVVYAAYDPELGRKVALKLLRAGDGSRSAGSGQARLIREAQALARLAHPNVVAIHDVGEHAGMVWLAMEHVDGVTLEQWPKDAARTVDEALDVLIAAGRGLAAAHAAGLLHRDFKPANVMVGSDGRVRVMDLGLARAARSTEAAPTGAAEPSRADDVLVTRAGAILGTPAYMSPEQFAGREPDVRSDVFAFCVTLHEALYGERPFAGETLVELVANVMAGGLRRPNPRRARGVPRWLRRVCVRGLAVDPARRFASMAALLAEVERGRSLARWRRWSLVTLGVAALVGGALGAGRYDLARRTAACAAEGAVIDDVWNDGARARVRAGMLATGARFAPHNLEILMPWLDAYRDAWREGRAEACAHTTIAGDWDAERLDHASWCFEDRRLQLEATVDQLSTLDRGSARRAVRIASYLDPVATCLDLALVQRLPTPPPTLRDEVRAIRASIGESDALRHNGRTAEALAVAIGARGRAEALGWSPLLSLARFTEGRCAFEAGEPADAEAVLVRAYFEAQRDGSTEVAFRSARSLVIVLLALRRHREAELWSRHADVFSASLDDAGGLDAAEGHYLMSEILAGLGDDEGAVAEAELAVAMRTATLGPDHPITAAASRNLGALYLAQGRLYEALARFDHAYAVWADSVGGAHPRVADLAVQRGLALWAIGQADEAVASLEEGLAGPTKSARGEHPWTLRALAALGRVLLAIGRVDEAEPMLRQVLEDARARHGPRDVAYAASLLDMAEVDRARGRAAAALERYTRAREILESPSTPEASAVTSMLERAADVVHALGRRREAIEHRRAALALREAATEAESRQLRAPLEALGEALLEIGELEEAHRHLERALAIGEQADDPDTGPLVSSLTGLSRVALAGGAVDEARRHAERAVRLTDVVDAGPRRAAGAYFALARALWAGGDRSARPRSLAASAARAYATCRDADGGAAVARWLDERGAPP